MTAFWVAFAVALVALLIWRLRRAGRKIDQILREERERATREAGEHADERARHPH